MVARTNNTSELNQSFDFRTWLKKHLFFILGILGFFAAATLFVLHRKEVYYR
ncbi:MAG: hypothetical protein ACOCNB_04435 [Acetivibrio ethanolgignens]